MGVVKGDKPFDSFNATRERILETAL
ncbi:MAG TPA: TetR/AcrR family transcriptional regulator, partial [Geobacter sulfurreducens]|nr:TetR/AcrR family transcriptional regulator [Geobacter sulfurreducens]HCD94748.1 TetR/AcrR family transcriptional regulator [Geobacter sulfurreducens]